MKIVKTIREKLGLTRYAMAKRLGISCSRYDYLECDAKITQLNILLQLRDLAKEAKISGDDFLDRLKADQDALDAQEEAEKNA